MTTQQAKNVIDLCKGNSRTKVQQLFSMARYSSSDIEVIAKELGCSADKETVITRLSF